MHCKDINYFCFLRDVKDGVHSQKGWSNTGEADSLINANFPKNIFNN